MGYHKERLIQQEEQGWTFSDKTICPRCVKDVHLKTLVRAAIGDRICDFCESLGRKRRGAPFDILMEAVATTFFEYYRPAVNHLGYEGGEYFGTTYDTSDLVYDEFSDISENEEVLTEVIDRFGQEIWCNQNPYGFSGADRYRVSWEEFCRVVKHDTRFFFSSSAATAERFGSDNELTPVPQVLEEIAGILQGMTVDLCLPAAASLFRVRPHEASEVCDTVRQLGPPPADKAPSNRMSAAGVSVFYGAFELETCAAEVSAGLPRRSRSILTGAEWRTTKEVRLVDLTRLPALGSPYAESREARAPHVFLREFVSEITKPVIHDGREHIEYVPTQIFTEYLRLFYLVEGHRIDGLVYPSAQRAHGRSVVLFASSNDLDPTGFGSSDAVLNLVASSIGNVRRRRPRQYRASYRQLP